MFDLTTVHDDGSILCRHVVSSSKLRLFWVAKRSFDIGFCTLLLSSLAVAAGLLLVLNPWSNRGPLIFRQVRMGRNCTPFTTYKFRSMVLIDKVARGALDPVEHHRITPLGQYIRRTRIDELPQIINVLKGEMSLIGPRPDYLPHAMNYMETVRGYRSRHDVRPGISGLAQTEIGYVQDLPEIRNKVLADLFYVQNAGFRLEAWVFWRTLCTVVGGNGK